MPHELPKELRGHAFMTSTKKSKFFDHHSLCPQPSNLKDPPPSWNRLWVLNSLSTPPPHPPHESFFKDFPRNNFATNSYRFCLFSKQRKNLIVLFVTGIFILRKIILQIKPRIYNYNHLNKRLWNLAYILQTTPLFC